MTSSADIDEALRTLDGSKETFRLQGKTMSADLHEVLTDAKVMRTIAGAPTLEWDVDDPKNELLKSGVLAERMSMGCGPFTFDLVSVEKSGTSLTMTGEDQAVAALRRKDSYLKVAKGTMTHVEFARKLVNEIPWLKFITDPDAKVVKSKEDLVRGSVSKKKGSAGNTKDSWDVLVANAQARGWRCFIRGVDEVWYVPDSFLFKDNPTFFLTERQGGVDSIDFEYDKGQKLATLTLTCQAALWAIPPANTAQVYDLGVADGKWLVQDVTRSPMSPQTQVTLIKPAPVLAEPSNSSPSSPGNGKLSNNAAVRVAQFAMQAKFTGKALRTAVAVSFAEDTTHDPKEDSPPNRDGSIDRGLWQINNAAHPEYSDAYCADGANNAKAAYTISNTGINWSPWTTFRNGAYLHFMSQAETAIKTAQRIDAEGTDNSGGGKAPPLSHSMQALDFVAEALSQRGKAYVFGAQTSPTNNDPKSFDCSLLVQWAAGRVGVTMPRTADAQYLFARASGTLISVAHATKVRGAVLYEAGSDGSNAAPGHTVISLGNGETIEARGTAYGVNEFGIAGRGFNLAALVPGMRY